MDRHVKVTIGPTGSSAYWLFDGECKSLETQEAFRLINSGTPVVFAMTDGKTHYRTHPILFK